MGGAFGVGMSFFRCLSTNFASPSVDAQCDAEFKAFDQCRQSIVKAQADATNVGGWGGSTGEE